MPQTIKPGDDITHLINGVNEGDDVTSLINGNSPSKPEESKESLGKRLTKGGVLDSSVPLSQRMKSLFFGDDTDSEGRKILGQQITKIPGTDWAKSKLDDIVNPPSEHPGVVRPFLSGALGGVADIIGSAGDARSAVTSKLTNPESYKAMMGAVDRGLPIDPSPVPIGNIKQGAANARPGLPAMGESTANPKPKFYNGPAGTTEAGKTYPMDIAPVNPRLGQQGAGTILPRETEGLTQLDPITAANRGTKLGDIQSLPMDNPRSTVIALDKVRRGEPIKMPTPEPIGNIEVPNERKLSDSFAPTDLPESDARPFGSTKNLKNGEWDTVREPKSKPQALDATGAKNGSTETSTELKSIGASKTSKKDYSTGVPAPGQAVVSSPEPSRVTTGSKDVNLIRAELGSVDKTLASRPETAPIAEHIINASDQKTKWVATTERQLADITKGLSKGDLVTLGDMVDKGTIPPGIDGHMIDRAKAIKEVLDQIHADLQLPQGMNMGYIENYLTHINKLPEDDLKTGIKQVWEYHLGKPIKDLFGSAELAGKGTGLGDMYEHGLGNPDSPFRRARGLEAGDIELNINKVLPAYIESIAKLKFDRPAVDAAKQVIKGLPDKDIYGNPSKIKELSEWYIKNYTRYDAMPGLTQGWNDLTSKLMRTTGRSMLGFSTGLQTLHLARIPANLYPELGEKYLAEGVKALVGQNPIKAWTEAASLGLLQNEVRPFSFKTPMEKVDSILSFMSGADFLDRSIGYHGFKAKFLAEGMDEATASARALAKSKETSLVVDSARPIKSFNPEGGPAGMAWRLSTQFKQVPIKIIEQYAGIASKMKEDPKTAARMVAGVGVAVAASEAGLHTFHISPHQAAVQMAGAVGTVVYSVYKDLAKGDIVSALKKTALWLTPGGMSIERQLRKGLSAFNQ